MITTIVICTLSIHLHLLYIRSLILKIDDMLKTLDAETTAIATEQGKLNTRVSNLVNSITEEHEIELTPEQEAEFNAISERQKLIVDSLSTLAADPAKPVVQPIDVAPEVAPVAETTVNTGEAGHE